MMPNNSIIVSGAGPAGMMAAIRAAQLGSDVTLLEINPILGRKLLLSGKGRCNLTNSCELDLFLKRFSGSGQFLRDAFKKFFNTELIDFFKKRGLGLRVERQGRVFPVTDNSASIVDALKKELLKQKVKILYKISLTGVVTEGGAVKGVACGKEFLPAQRVILATGGVSYGFTGSTGGGLKIAAHLGHTIEALRPGLVPARTAQRFVKQLEGITLKNIRVKFSDGHNQVTTPVGELLFTAHGISGPLVLTFSGHLGDWLSEKKKVYARIDIKPGLSVEQLDARLLREFAANARKCIKNTLKLVMPRRLGDVCLEILKIDPECKCGQLRHEQRKGIIDFLKKLKLDISGLEPIEDAMVTRGGVSLKEINPRTMESRLIKGLYFAGEMIDVDADTGGFNLQAAFSTGYLAGESAAT